MGSDRLTDEFILFMIRFNWLLQFWESEVLRHRDSKAQWGKYPSYVTLELDRRKNKPFLARFPWNLSWSVGPYSVRLFVGGLPLDWLTEEKTICLSVYLSVCVSVYLSAWVTDRPTYWLTDRPRSTIQPTDRPTNGLTDCFHTDGTLIFTSDSRFRVAGFTCVEQSVTW